MLQNIAISTFLYMLLEGSSRLMCTCLADVPPLAIGTRRLRGPEPRGTGGL